jgi:hypothetical protein
MPSKPQVPGSSPGGRDQYDAAVAQLAEQRRRFVETLSPLSPEPDIDLCY